MGRQAKTNRQPSLESTLGAVVAHPTRTAAYVILVEEVSSPKAIADELGADLSHVGYHVRKLEEFGLIELVHQEPVRGAVRHLYRATSRPLATEDDLREMTTEQREDLTRYILQLMFADAARAIDEGTFDIRLDRWLVRVPMNLDDEGFAELGKIHEGLYDATLEVQENVYRRRAAAAADGLDHETFPAQAAAMFHELPERRPKSRGKA